MDIGELQKDESVVRPAPSAPPLTPLACNSDDDHEYPRAPITTTTGIPASTHPSPISTSTHPHAPVPWSTGLCGCWEDVSSCCLTCWCPCITFGRIAEIVDRGSSSCGVSGSLYSLMMCAMGWSCLYSCFYRTKLRGQYFLEESPACCTDCCVHFCCEECALCQEYRQLQNQGFDMSIGWHGNVERQKRLAAAIPPQVQGGMTR